MPNELLNVKVKKLHPEAIIPQYQTNGAACFDLHAIAPDGAVISQDEHLVVDTGLAFEIPQGYVMLVYSRSGHGFKYGARLSNSVGVIDSDYRGEVKVKLHKDTSGSLHIAHGDRIAQALILPVPFVNLYEAEDLAESARGEGGMGSTGA